MRLVAGVSTFTVGIVEKICPFKGYSMALTKYYEIKCDIWGWVDHFVDNSVSVIIQAKVCGWISIDEKHYCSAQCRDKYIVDKVVRINGQG